MSKVVVWIKHVIRTHQVISAAILFMCVMGGTYAATAKTDFALTPQERLDHQFLHCVATPALLKAIACIHSQVNSWVEHYGIAAVVHELDKYQKRYNADFTCHMAGHEIGAAVFAADKGNMGEALQQCTSACFNSCLHGATIAYMASSTVQQFLALKPEQYCAQMPSDEYKPCIHGIGHALLVGERYNINAALQDCKQLVISDPELDQCYTGIYMELTFAADGLAHGNISPSIYHKEGDPFYPCDVAPTITNSDWARQCFIQITANLLNHYVPAHPGQTIFQLCQTAPTAWVDTCAVGVGMSRTAAAIDNVGIQKLCGSAPTDALRKDCLFGAYLYLVFGGKDLGNSLPLFCKSLSAQDQEVCSPTFNQQTFDHAPVPMGTS